VLLAVGGAAPLALRAAGPRRGVRLRLTAVAVVLLAVAVGLPGLVPPVPLRMTRATFASGIERTTLELTDTLGDHVSSAKAGTSLFVLVEVFAPSALPANVRLEWRRDGELLRVYREVDITAHAGGFRVWDGWHPTSGPIPPGRYRVVLQTAGRRVFGVVTLQVDE
jgi:hypothetical protein